MNKKLLLIGLALVCLINTGFAFSVNNLPPPPSLPNFTDIEKGEIYVPFVVEKNNLPFNNVFFNKFKEVGF